MATGRKTEQPRAAERRAPASDRVLLRGVRYETYVALRDEPDNRGLRMTYHDGTLEITSPVHLIHESMSRLFGLIVVVVSEEHKIACEGAGSTTIMKGIPARKKGSGAEPDESFYFANVGKILGKAVIDLASGDPPPDLWIEVDHRVSSQSRPPVYEALGVPEVWRYNVSSKRLDFMRLRENRAGYEPIESSVNLPMLTPALVLHALSLKAGQPESIWMSLLREWVRATFSQGN